MVYLIVDVSHSAYNITRLFSSDMNKPCWKLVKACPQSQKLFCFRENNLLVKWFFVSGIVSHLKFTLPDHFSINVILSRVISLFMLIFLYRFCLGISEEDALLLNTYHVQCVYFSGIQESMICVVDRNQILFGCYIFRSYFSSNLHGEWNSTAVLTFFFYISHLTDNYTKI